MKNLFLTILKQSGGVPDNVTTTSTKINDGGLILIGIIIGVMVACLVMGIFKSIKNDQTDNEESTNRDKTNNDKDENN